MNKEKESKQHTSPEQDPASGENNHQPEDQDSGQVRPGAQASNGENVAENSPEPQTSGKVEEEKETDAEAGNEKEHEAGDVNAAGNEKEKEAEGGNEEGDVDTPAEMKSEEDQKQETDQVEKNQKKEAAPTNQADPIEADQIEAEEEKKADQVTDQVDAADQVEAGQGKEDGQEEESAIQETERAASVTDTQKDSPEKTADAGTASDVKESGTENTAAAKKPATDLESEVDLKEKDDDHDEDDEDEADYSDMSKAELVEVIKDLAKSDQVIKAEREARDVKHAFDEIRHKEREEALEKFVAEGGDAMDFAYRPDELTLRFDANYQLVRDRKSNFVKTKEEQKETNLRKKEEILVRLREFVDSEETNISFESFKKLQEEWKSIGPVPGAIARSLWANYNALVDRFYDKRSIYFELKELDRKKNLESKLELCERAEALAEVTNINDAIKELNELHHEFKHIGPVPKEEQEPLWQRFKAASDAVYERRKEFVEKLKGELEKNLVVKLELSEKVSEFAEFDSDRIKAWNEKTRELLDIQKKWENTGGLPRARAKEVNRSFWSAFKQFFANKNHFFKKLDAEREKNLEKKKEMVEKARALCESDNWHETAEKLKALQREWKDVGPVPGKYRESVYKEFKEACDTFFTRKRASQDDASKNYTENYKTKLDICNKIEKLAKGDKNNLEEFKSLQEEYNETGFVPRNKITDIRNRYSEVVNAYVKALDGMTDEEKQRIKIENQVSDILHSPNADQKLYRKEQSLRKQISSIENDIAVWKNNLEFFADSKKANKLKDEFQSKIDQANDELRQLKQQLKIIRTA